MIPAERPAAPPAQGTPTGATATDHVDLTIDGMTCASCAARIEKRLNKLDGVTASVNFATERASVDFPATVAPGDLVAAVESAGYSAALPAPPRSSAHGHGHDHVADDDEGVVPRPAVGSAADLRQRLIVSTVLGVPVIAMAMIPALQFRYWQWLSLTLASPVIIWGAYPFHLATWRNARHGATTMDTLVSLGTLSAYLWSLWALFFGDAGMPDMTMPFSFTVTRARAPTRSTSRWRRASPSSCSRAATSRPGPSGARARPCGPCSSSGPRTWPCSATASRSGCRSTRWWSATASWCGRARRSPPTAWSRRARRPSTRRCSPARACRSRWGRATASSAPR